jgi:hypothetical protein
VGWKRCVLPSCHLPLSWGLLPVIPGDATVGRDVGRVACGQLQNEPARRHAGRERPSGRRCIARNVSEELTLTRSRAGEEQQYGSGTSAFVLYQPVAGD